MTQTLSHPERIDELAKRFWAFQCEEFPAVAILAGETTRDATLFRSGPQDAARRAAIARDLLSELAMVDSNDLESQERATRSLLQRDLHDLIESERVMAYARPTLFPMGPVFDAVNLADVMTVDGAGAQHYIEQLCTIPSFLDDVRQSFEAGRNSGITYPRSVVAHAIENLRALIALPPDALPWMGPVMRGGARDTTLAAVRDVAAQTIVPAIARHIEAMEAVLLKSARGSIACTDTALGHDFYRYAVQLYTTTQMSPERINAVGLSEVERLRYEMQSLARDAGRDNVAAYHRYLAQDESFVLPSPEALRERAEALCKRIDGSIPAYFGHLPRTTYGVRTIPQHLSPRLPAAYAQPNPANNKVSGTFWITAEPQKAPAYMLPSLALHEAWPGHLMHLALVQEQSNLPAFRRYGFMKYSACLEGWGMYCEWLGNEMSLYETPHERFGALSMEMFRAARLVVDTGIHWMEWTRDRALAFMLDNVVLPRAALEAEVDRYIALPAQALSYQIGHRAIRDLRQDIEQELGDRFDVRSFHDAVLAAGAVTIPLLQDLVRSALVP